MARVKGGNVARKRRKKILKLAKGYFGSKHTLYRTANEQVMKSLQYAFRDRKQTKRNFRKLWIARINAAARMHDLSYSKLMHGLKCTDIDLNRKMLAEIAIHDPKGFEAIVDSAKKALAKGQAPTANLLAAKEARADYTVVSGTDKKAEKVAVKAAAEKTAATEETKSQDTKEELALEKMTLAQLKAEAKAQGKKGYSTLTKDELIALLK